MTQVSRFVIAAAMACPFLAHAEGKCDDDPFWLDPQKTQLGVTWTFPVPADAVASVDTAAVLMKQLDALSPVEPNGFPAEYAYNVWPVDYSPQGTAIGRKFTNAQGHDNWLSQYGLTEGAKAASITARYIGESRVLFGMVVRHPPVPEKSGTGYEFCTCMLQRAVLLWDANAEQLWLRSRFRSAKKDKKNWANFELAAPLKFTFSSSTLWFPLGYNEVLPEPPAFLVLDVVTRKALSTISVPSGFTVENLGQVNYDGKSWFVSRLRRRYDQGEPQADLSMAPP